MQVWWIALLALTYILSLFAIAWYGDRRVRKGHAFDTGGGTLTAVYYSMTLMVYLTAWSFFGSVGRAVTQGYDFSAIYVGPTLMLLFGRRILARVILVAKEQNVTSVADFIAARYGKSQMVAALVTISAVVALLPYIALQLKAIASSWDMLTLMGITRELQGAAWPDTALAITLLMTLFAILFGVRHVHVSEHHPGLMLAIAFESIIKLVVFLALTGFVVFGLFHGVSGVVGTIAAAPELRHLSMPDLGQPSWWANTLLSAIAFVCLPHMFHVMVVESHDARHIRTAALLVPPYLLFLTGAVVLIAAVGIMSLDPAVNADMFVLAVPLAAGRIDLGALAFIGGLSAATGMVIVAAVSLSTMICNDLLVPWLIRRPIREILVGTDFAARLLSLRRWTVAVILMLAYVMYRILDRHQSLVSIGLLSFVAVAQLAPPFFAGLYWQRGNGKGAVAGLCAGLGGWCYTLLLPALFSSQAAPAWINGGPLGITWLAPHALLGLGPIDPVAHATFWSLLVNILAYVAVSCLTGQKIIEKAQARAFTSAGDMPGPDRDGPSGPLPSLADCEMLAGRYVGAAHAARAFASFRASNPHFKDGDAAGVGFTERLLAGTVGSASARIVMALWQQPDQLLPSAARAILNEAGAAIRFNRDLLLATLENVSQGICVFDPDFRVATWNRRFLTICALSDGDVRVGMPIAELVEHNLGRRGYGADDIHMLFFSQDVSKLTWPYRYDRHRPDGTILEICFTRIPEGGYVATYTDVTEDRRAASELEARVQQRTLALAQATEAAEKANRGKTRFLAAASHDLLQPLNAARLFTASLNDRLSRPTEMLAADERQDERRLAAYAAASLASVEQLLLELLDISAFDGGSVQPARVDFHLDVLICDLAREFSELARRRGLDFRVRVPKVVVYSDPALLRRIVQNFLSNALRYTQSGGVLLGFRRRGGQVRLEVWDTGPGIPEDKQAEIFQEFRRLRTNHDQEKGLGLGLSIVERIASILQHPVTVRSTVGRGSMFAIAVPVGTPERVVLPAAELPAQIDPLFTLNVWCVDNEPDILSGLRSLLEGWGCQVTSDDGRKVADWTGNVPDALLIDYHLDEDRDGLTLVGRLRQAWGREVPVLLITADRSEKVAADAQGLGVDISYKPVRPAALRAWLARVARARAGNA